MLATETCIVAAVRNQPQNIADVRVTRPSRTRWRPAASMTRDGSQNSTFSLRSFISRPSRAVSQERRTIGDCVDSTRRRRHKPRFTEIFSIAGVFPMLLAVTTD
jgi:hypothetical protein